MTQFGKWAWCSDHKKLEPFPRTKCRTEGCDGHHIESEDWRPDSPGHVRRPEKNPLYVGYNHGLRCLSGCPRSASMGKHEEFAPFCCMKCYHGSTLPHSEDCEARARVEGTTCDDEGCEHYLTPHSHGYKHTFKIPTLPQSLTLDFGDKLGQMHFPNVRFTLINDLSADFSWGYSTEIKKKKRKRSLLHKKRSPEANNNWLAYAKKDEKLQIDARMEREMRDRQRQTYKVGGDTFSLPAALPGEPIRDAECEQCGATWVEPVYVNTLYCPKTRHHMGYHYKKSPHRHCVVKKTAHREHKTCCECGTTIDAVAEATNGAIRAIASMPVSNDPGVLGGLHKMIMQGVEYNRTVETQTIEAQARTFDRLVQPDDPEADGTDAAHPAWWRGNDAGVESAAEKMRDALMFKDNGNGVIASKKLESVRRLILALNENVTENQERVRKLQETFNNRVHGRRWLEKFIKDQLPKYQIRAGVYGPDVLSLLKQILDKVQNLDFTIHPEFK